MQHLAIKKLSGQDLHHLIALIKVYETVFVMDNFKMPDPTYLNDLLKKDNVFFFVALLDGTVIGGLTAYVLPSPYFPSSEVYLYDLAVETAVQRKGVGKSLMTSLKNYCAGLGYKEVFVQADLVDQRAIDFYRATGGTPEDVIHFSYSLTDPAVGEDYSNGEKIN